MDTNGAMRSRPPLRILHLRDTHEVGGPGKTILETHRAIDQSRFQLHLAVFLRHTESENSPFLAAARDVGMPVHVLRTNGPYDPRVITRLARLVRAERIDIVEGHEPSSDVIAYLASFLCRTTLINTSHGWIGNSPKQRFFNALDKRVLRRYQLVMAVSGSLETQLLGAGLRRDRVHLLHNGIVLDRYRRSGQRGFLRELTGRTIVGPVLASIGRLSAEKGHADLIEALATVAAAGHQVTTVLAGDGPNRAALVEQIRLAGLEDRVLLPGHVSRPAQVLEETDLMVLPSHTEGLPNAALEALAMEVPVLATRVGGTPEVITDGETGRLVDARSPAALAAGILEFLGNRSGWQRMAAAGRARVEEHFDFRARTRKLEGIYAGLTSGRVS